MLPRKRQRRPYASKKKTKVKIENIAQMFNLKRKLLLIVCILVINVFVTVFINTNSRVSNIERTPENASKGSDTHDGVNKLQTETRMHYLDLPVEKKPHQELSQNAPWQWNINGSSNIKTVRDHLFGFEKWTMSKTDFRSFSRSPSLKQFARTMMTPSQRTELRKVFFATVRLLQNLKVQYSLHAGTLAGSYLHHNMIPWDDDVDIITNISNKVVLQRAFSNATSTQQIDGISLSLKMFNVNWWKIYQTRSVIKSKIYWPFIDVAFYIDDGRYILHRHGGRRFRHDIRWTKHKFFPLQVRPFEGTLQPVPCDVKYVLEKKFMPGFEDDCFSLSLNHRTETKWKQVVHQRCKKLHPYLPFVKRLVLRQGYILELLKVNNTLLGYYFSGTKFCS